MATIRISNIEAKADAGSPSIDERVTFKRSTGQNAVVIDAKQVGITSVGINTDNPQAELHVSGSIKSDTITADSISGVVSGFATDVSINTTGIITASNLTVGEVSYPNAGPLSNRNLVINGNMLIDQRNGGSSTTPSTDQTYVIDRWKIRNTGGTGRFSVEQSSSSPNNIDPSMLSTVTTTATPGASEFYAIEQSIEGYNFARTAAGSAASEILTLSFSVRSSLTGTYCCSLRNSDGSRSFISEYTINAADTWETKTIEIPAITSGTWNTTTGTGASLDWCLGAGSNFEGSTGWQSVNRVATSNQVDWINSNGATFYITGVQLEVGSVATPFEHRSFGDEFARCQRYYQDLGSNSFGSATGIDAAYANTKLLPVAMRTTPTVSFTWATGNGASIVGESSVVIRQSGTHSSNVFVTILNLTAEL